MTHPVAHQSAPIGYTAGIPYVVYALPGGGYTSSFVPGYGYGYGGYGLGYGGYGGGYGYGGYGYGGGYGGYGYGNGGYGVNYYGNGYGVVTSGIGLNAGGYGYGYGYNAPSNDQIMRNYIRQSNLAHRAISDDAKEKRLQIERDYPNLDFKAVQDVAIALNASRLPTGSLTFQQGFYRTMANKGHDRATVDEAIKALKGTGSYGGNASAPQNSGGHSSSSPTRQFMFGSNATQPGTLHQMGSSGFLSNFYDAKKGGAQWDGILGALGGGALGVLALNNMGMSPTSGWLGIVGLGIAALLGTWGGKQLGGLFSSPSTPNVNTQENAPANGQQRQKDGGILPGFSPAPETQNLETRLTPQPTSYSSNSQPVGIQNLSTANARELERLTRAQKDLNAKQDAALNRSGSAYTPTAPRTPYGHVPPAFTSPNMPHRQPTFDPRNRASYFSEGRNDEAYYSMKLGHPVSKEEMSRILAAKQLSEAKEALGAPQIPHPPFTQFPGIQPASEGDTVSPNKTGGSPKRTTTRAGGIGVIW